MRVLTAKTMVSTLCLKIALGVSRQHRQRTYRQHGQCTDSYATLALACVLQDGKIKPTWHAYSLQSAVLGCRWAPDCGQLLPQISLGLQRWAEVQIQQHMQ